jgi:AraC-like DNA-binding protein
MEGDFTVPSEYARPIAEQLRSMGVDVQAWLSASGVPAGALEQPGGLLPFEALRALVAQAIAAAREPALGLFVGERMVASTHGVVGAAATNAGTVRQALEVVERFSRLRSSLFEITHEVDATEGRLIFREARPLAEVQRPLLEAVVLSVKNVLDEATMGACPIHEVVFPFEAPPYAALARDVFGCPVRYGQDWAGLSAAIGVLDVPLKLADPATFEVAAAICQRELDLLAENESLAARVRRLLLGRQNGFPSLQVTARHMHMTPRTLHRRLLEEGTSYRALLESVRHTLAVELLESGRCAMDEIAYRLGYTDLSNFRRAFKRWEHVPPSEYRARLAQA